MYLRYSYRKTIFGSLFTPSNPHIKTDLSFKKRKIYYNMLILVLNELNWPFDAIHLQ